MIDPKKPELTLTLKRVRRGLRTELTTGLGATPAGTAVQEGSLSAPADPNPGAPLSSYCTVGLKKNFIIGVGYKQKGG